jgi:hypothetical protein
MSCFGYRAEKIYFFRADAAPGGHGALTMANATAARTISTMDLPSDRVRSVTKQSEQSILSGA